jgi:O-antigen ligase
VTEKKDLGGLLETIFLWSIILIGWGSIRISLGSGLTFTIYGSTWESFFPLFFLYFLCRLHKRELKIGESWRDPVLILGLIGALSVLWNPLRDSALFTDLYLPALAGYFIFRYLLDGDFPSFSRRFWPFFIGAVCLMVIRGIAGRPQVLSSFSFLDSPFAHHNHIAMNILLALPVALALFLENRGKRLFYGTAIGIMLTGFILTNSRSGWIGAAALALFLLVKSKNQKLKIAFVALLLAAVIVMSFFPFSRTRLLTLSAPLADSSFQCRITMWKISAQIFRDHPFIGIGFSNNIFTAMEHKYAQVLFHKGIITEPQLFDPHPHNLLVQVLVYLGLAGFSILLWIISSVFDTIGFIAKREEGSAFLLTALQASLIGFLVSNFGDTVLHSTQTTLTLFLLLGYLFEWKKHLAAKPEPAGNGEQKVGTDTAAG